MKNVLAIGNSTNPAKPTNFTIFPPTDNTKSNTLPGIKLRLISLRSRTGLNWIDVKNPSDNFTNEGSSFIKKFSSKFVSYKERSKYLLIHCHGGGFVAQSAKSHDVSRIYLE